MTDRRPASSARLLSPLRDFLRTEIAGGIVLVAAAVAAVVWANSPWSGGYERLWQSEIAVRVAGHVLAFDLRHWLNDGVMVIFFLVVGLEIKREMTSGHLAGRRAAALPIAAAVGGMAVPALVYLAIAGREAAHGWGVAMATDIALALGIVALAGRRVPPSLRAFLLGLAVVDDIGAIVVIAVFYSTGFSLGWFAAAAGCFAVAVAVRRSGVQHASAFVVIGVVMWFSLHEAGIHPTIAGVAFGLLAPSVPHRTPEFIDIEELTDLSSVEAARESTTIARESVSVVEWLQHLLHPWTSYVIVPLFALANAGVVVSGPGFRSALGSVVFWGIAAGLVIGKPLGVFLATRVALGAGIADPPADVDRRRSLGAGWAAGIGFTVALFIAELAFTDESQRAEAKLAILLGSVASAVIGLVLLRSGPSPTARAADADGDDSAAVATGNPVACHGADSSLPE